MTTKLLANQLHGILNDPVEGFTVELADESSLYEWKVYIEGPKDTVYEGGVFQLSLSFPKDYPMSPPTLKFISSFWHPNVYTDGKVCMSILHPPGDDAMSGELAQERWLPTQSVTTIVLSLLSLLNDPNCSSPANVDASVEWRKNREAYISKCKKLVEKANREKPAHIKIPHPDTNEEEHKKIVQKWKEMNKELDYEDFYEAHEENDESEPESDENENEFLESNEEMNSEDEEDEVEKKKNGADKKESKGKSPVLSTAVDTSDNSKTSSSLAEPQDDSARPSTTTTSTTTTTSSSLPTSSSEKVVSSSSVSVSASTTIPSTVPESSSTAPLPASSGSTTTTTTSSSSRVVDNSIIEESSASSSNRNNGGSSSDNNSNLIMNDNTINNNNNNNATTPRSEGKRKKSKSSKKKKCIIM